jgi:sec1 family domain-containing protein 1
VYDQFLNYVSLEDSLFTLDIEKCLSRVLGAKDGLEGIVDRSVSGLFSVLMSFGGNAPIICLKEDEAGDSLVKNICSKLESRIKSHLINTKSPLSLDSSHTSSTSNAHQSRPLLLVLDRRVDLAAPLKHSSTYNALIDEILGLDANRVQIGSKSFDIDRRDWFWRENSNKSFPKVAEAVEVALKTYKQEYDRVLQTTPGMTEDLMRANGNSAIEASIESSLTPDQLKVAINVLPELTERKRLIDTHLQICTALLESLKSRDLGTLFNIEQEMISSSTSTGQATTASMTTAAWNSLLSTLKDAKIGNSQDKLRLLLIHILYNEGGGSQNGRFIQEALDVLKPTGSDLKAFQFVTQRLLEEDANLATNQFDFENKTLKTSNSSSKATSPGPLDQNSFAFGDFFTKLSTTTGNLVSSVKNLMPSGSGISESPLTRLIDSAYASAIVNTAPQLQQQLKFLDPRPVSSKSASSVSSSSFSIDHIILFVLGGAAYAEYDHLLEHFERSKNLQSLKFTLGVSEVLNPKKYLNQLSEKKLNQ